jgi:hypothetical protein
MQGLFGLVALVALLAQPQLVNLLLTLVLV